MISKVRNLALGAAFLALAMSAAAPAADQSYTLRLATWGSPTHPQVTEWVPFFSSEVERNSKGRIKVQVYPAASLIKEPDVASAIPAGVADISLAVLEDFSGVDPEIGIFGTPLMDLNFDAFAKAMHPGSELFNATNDSLRKHGMVLLSAIDIGPPVFVGKEPLRTAADFHGKNIRVYSAGTAAIVQSLGAAPTQLNQNDVYAALSTGTVQASYGGLGGIYGLEQYEVAKFLTLPGPIFGLDINGYVMNAAKLDGMAPDLRKIVLDAATKANARANEANKRMYATFAAEIGRNTGNGVAHLEFKTFREPIQNLMTQAQTKFGATDPIVRALLKARSGHR